MKRLPAILIAAGTAIAIPALAQRTSEYTYAYDPATNTYVEKVTVYYDEPATVTYVAPSSTVTYYEPARVTYVESPIIVTAPRSEDDAITLDVMDRIASDGGISGRVGVDTYRNTVTLSGRVATPWQADKAQRHAQNTPGVREVDNQLRSRIGG